MITVGLTGGIGSGKSTVARMLAERGAVVVDADQLARDAVRPGTPGLAQVLAEFGDQVRAEDGSLDRAALASLVFADPAALARLNAIVHPLVGARSAQLVEQAAAAGARVVVHDVPLLVENGLQAAYDVVLVVEAPLEVRLGRLAERGVSRDDALARIEAQASDEQRRAVADCVLDNGADLAGLAEEVARCWSAVIAPRLAAG